MNDIAYHYIKMVVRIHRRMVDMEVGIFQDMYNFETILWNTIDKWADDHLSTAPKPKCPDKVDIEIE